MWLLMQPVIYQLPNMPTALTNAQLQKLSAGISALDGVRTSPDSFEPFHFDSDTTWNLALNHTLIQSKLEPYEVARKALAKMHGITERMQVNPADKEVMERVGAFMAALDELQAKSVSVDGLVKINKASLNIGTEKGKNRIPVSVLANLMPIIE